MGSAALKPSVAVGRLLRNRRHEMRLTLRDVSERIQEMGERFPTSTLIRVEQGKLDPGVRRLHLLMKLYRIPPHLVADLVEIEEHAVEEPRHSNLERLRRQGVEHLKRGRTGQALAHLFAIRQHAPDDDESRLLRQQATLTFAIAARDLGKRNLAAQLVDDLLCEPEDPSLRMNLLVLASSLWHGKGAVEVALALIRQAATHIRRGDHAQRAWIRHQEGRLLLEAGSLEQASEAIADAIQSYRKGKDVDGEARAMIVEIQVRVARGEIDTALKLARRVIRIAERAGHDLPLVSGRLELGRLLVLKGDAEKGLRELRKALSRAVLLENALLEFHAHYHLWKAHEALGDQDRARLAFQSASHFVRRIDPASPEAREIRKALEETAQRPRH
jgi:tetratricopeptide (TPR) repeat protein